MFNFLNKCKNADFAKIIKYKTHQNTIAKNAESFLSKVCFWKIEFQEQVSLVEYCLLSNSLNMVLQSCSSLLLI